MSADYNERRGRDPRRSERKYVRGESDFGDRASDESAGQRHPIGERDSRGDPWKSPDRWHGDDRTMDRERVSEHSRRSRDHEARRRGHGGETGHDTSWSGASTGTYGQGQYGSRGVPWYDTSWDRGEPEPEGPFAGRGPKGYQRADSRIGEDVSDRLTDAPDIDASEIEVTVNNGEVTLSGTVRNRYEKRRSEDVSERVAGVRDVHNNLRINRSPEG